MSEENLLSSLITLLEEISTM